ncbi:MULTISPECIES: TetR/AcrR family transcriptional regulator [Streptosporangium]|uniref:AcrR family transcriptional regulator n=1 Tax=Streptosporangium brasiliense TaxID=47480 RepID=A0ABT9QZF7_9ACTN|nr:TetR/AcrR family transcriptional regulator [Streptosporangium brasiliense]MDP9862343.1 AcrR family transcriptional regulator [Streptosporangium brasiliense]
MTSADGGQRELILQVATRLFAALGYDATSVSQIAEAAGLDIAAITGSVGSKRDLYLAVMERAHQAELTGLERSVREIAAAAPEETTAAVHRLIDDYIDFCTQNSEFPALWMHRWLFDASDVTELDRHYVQPLVQYVTEALAPLTSGSTDLKYVIWSVIWCTHAFARGGVLDEDGNRVGPEDPETLRRFRAYLHQMLHCVLTLPGDAPPAPGGPPPAPGPPPPLGGPF